MKPSENAVFNSLTGSTPFGECRRLLVAPGPMRSRFTELIRREAEHAEAGRPCGIRAMPVRATYEVRLKEGRKRQIRRMFEAFGRRVVDRRGRGRG